MMKHLQVNYRRTSRQGRRNLLFSMILCVFVVLIAQSAQAQFRFGQNKVQYTDFKWRVMTTEHFKIYYYDEEEYVAQMAAKIAEDSYLQLRKKFNHEIFSEIPLIIYSSPLYFSQTNTTSSFISESTGGFTEFFKGRMVVPFTGSYAMFDHVIRHELVHVFTLSKLSRIQRDQRRRQHTLPPLWFIEGLAEFWSTEWDSQAGMMVGDMTLSGNTLAIRQFHRVYGSFMMYKLGQSVCEFIDREYGSDKLVLILENWWKAKRFEDVVELTLGESLAQVSKKWEYSLKKKYFPMMAEGDLAKNVSRQLTMSGYAAKSAPIMFDDGDGEREWIIYKADKLGYSSLYMMDGSGENRKVHTLLKGERSADFESLHLLSSGIDAHKSGLVAFSSKAKETDALYIYDLKKRRIDKQVKIDGLVMIKSPRFSPDGTKITISGVDKSGAADIYLVDLISGLSERLTDDIYQDIDPVFTLDGDTILFASDRGPWGDRGATDIYALALDSRTMLAMTSNSFSDRSPEPTENGFVFASSRGGVTNAYVCDSLHQFSQLTNSLTGVYDPRISPADGDLIYTGYQDFRFHVFRSAAPDSLRSVAQSEFVEISDDQGAWRPGTLASESIQSSKGYDLDYSFDVAQTALSFDPVFGTLGGVQVRMSDMLGNHIFFGFLSNSAQTKDDILSSFNLGISYLNLEKRLNWGVGGFHLFNQFWNRVDGTYFERQIGGYAQLSYPISRFSRVETSLYARYRDKDMFLLRRRLKQGLVSNFVSYVYDNSLWEATGPLDGRRINLTLGITTSLHDQRINDVIALADIRNYLRLGRSSAFATRIFGYTSGGSDPRRIYHGGSWSFRGFSRRQWYTPNIVFISNELRFPLINRLLLGLPIGNLGFSAIRGALFYDTGAAWEQEYEGLIGSFGAGLRFGLGRVMTLRFDWSYRHDYETIDPDVDFDFFFGWNF